MYAMSCLIGTYIENTLQHSQTLWIIRRTQLKLCFLFMAAPRLSKENVRPTYSSHIRTSDNVNKNFCVCRLYDLIYWNTSDADFSVKASSAWIREEGVFEEKGQHVTLKASNLPIDKKKRIPAAGRQRSNASWAGPLKSSFFGVIEVIC